MTDLTVLYYTSNYLEEHNPYFVSNTKRQLLTAIGNTPLISISQQPMDFGKNICIGNIGRSHLNIYKQMLIGAKAATTKYVAMAEDDLLYPRDHFDYRPTPGVFAYNMCKWSIFTWIRPAMFGFKNRRVINSLICERDLLIESLEERFTKYPDPEKTPIHYWGDLGRYEHSLGVTVRKTEEFYSKTPIIYFSHENSYGYLALGHRKKLEPLRAYDIPEWGKADDILKLYYEH
jgi:hypothetical protein